MFDIVCFSETKLDDSIPNSFYKNDFYFKLRLDRSRHGGGLTIQSKSNKLNFVYSYRAPNLKEQLFLDKLDDFIHTLNLNDPLFIVGDFNMNFDLNNINSNVREFSCNNNLVNFVQKPTRVAKKFFKKTNSYKCSSTLIDLFLNNGDLIDQTDVIDCPFSDNTD
ncbi:unnamed protein product [Brachionus calyciflorus]|uniref:Endonuclease/exonuclease/phosphatase domain-containing protein n=1 Tax=Brachionus calyciflorus TaxID=104777 RepID=A0A814KY31_9BILA|nr:unnamed protein product [Brachionus calyciflorus]